MYAPQTQHLAFHEHDITRHEKHPHCRNCQPSKTHTHLPSNHDGSAWHSHLAQQRKLTQPKDRISNT